ncbi:MAG: hypothetical protein JWM12_26 [Ilumatobacteraceae bacterium]|nr:hypothetical protein [Ilumatobacteraceae bacterium]
MSAVQPSAVDDAPQTRYLAGFGVRLGAFTVDGLLAVASVVPGLAVLAMSPTVRRPCTVDDAASTCSVASPGWLSLSMTITVVGFAAYLGWYCLRVSRGQSPGQRRFGVQVVDQVTVASIGPWRVFARQFTQFASAVPFGLGYLWMLWDPRSQTWHDKLVGTIVIQA